MGNETLVSPRRSQLHQPATPRKSRSPLRVMNTPQKLPPKSPKSPIRAQSPTKLGSQRNEAPPTPLLQRQHSELVAKNNTLSIEYSQLEEELNKKNALVDELAVKVSNTEKVIKALQDERRNELALYEKEIAFYKDTIADLKRKSLRYLQQLEHGRSHSHQVSQELDDKYAKLLKSVKALQLDLELERNLKALLIDQIEYLTKERDFLLEHGAGTAGNSPAASRIVLGALSERSSVLCHDITPKPSQRETFDDENSLSDGSVHGSHMLSSLADELGNPDEVYEGIQTSSPIKSMAYTEDNFLDIANNFQFPPSPERLPPPQSSRLPPSPDLDIKNIKRKSLPTRLKDQEEFVLSPLKLTSNNNGSYFEPDTSLPATSRSVSSSKRYLAPKANHSRYNSHDFMPIKVEFEQKEPLHRSSSAPTRDLLNNLKEVDEDNPGADQDEALMKLQGLRSSKRDSLLTTSSKHSSMFTDLNILSSDITKQEIMKLKFELQSLKLHNEKLLSYIGFELQKQKKNIKKLSSRSNLRGGNIEYSDAKLIEKLRNMLIQKKRVLRSVSINPILSTKSDAARRQNIFEPALGLGIMNAPLGPEGPEEEDEDFVFKSHFINSLEEADCDDYGFLTQHRKHSLRLFSNNTQAYFSEADQRQPKKSKSQTFSPSGAYEDDSFSQLDTDWDQSIDGDEKGEEQVWEDTESERSSGSEVDYGKLNTFNQLRYLIMGKENFRKKKRTQEEPLVDEHLKYKFLTLVIGITVLGLRFTTHPQQHN